MPHPTETLAVQPVAIPGQMPVTPPLRHDWSRDEILALLDQPFMDLVFQAQATHRAHFVWTSTPAGTVTPIFAIRDILFSP